MENEKEQLKNIVAVAKDSIKNIKEDLERISLKLNLAKKVLFYLEKAQEEKKLIKITPTFTYENDADYIDMYNRARILEIKEEIKHAETLKDSFSKGLVNAKEAMRNPEKVIERNNQQKGENK